MKKLEEIYLPIKDELKRFDEALRCELVSSNGFIGGMLNHILKGRGKRVRPALVFLSSNGSARKKDATSLAVAIELVHIASLVHDDVIDEAPKRRKAQSLNYKWGNTTSVLLGDFLYTKAFKNVAALESPKIESILSDVAMAMCEGELMQIEKNGDLNITEQEYLKIIKQKTALLISASCECAAMLNGLSIEEVAALKSYGLNIGMAFQIVDDYLDIKGNGALLGKLTGSDIGKGKLTLPFIYGLGVRDVKIRHDLIKMISPSGRLRTPSPAAGGQRQASHSQSENGRPLRLDKIAVTLERLGAFDKTAKKALGYAQKAKEDILCLKPSQCRDSLEELAGYIVKRDK